MKMLLPLRCCRYLQPFRRTIPASQKAATNVSDNPHKCEGERAQHDCDPNNPSAQSQDALPSGHMQVRQPRQ